MVNQDQFIKKYHQAVVMANKNQLEKGKPVGFCTIKYKLAEKGA